MPFHPAGRAARVQKFCARHRLLSSASLIALVLSPLPALGAPPPGIWQTGGASTNYSDTLNWTGGAVPASNGTGAFNGQGSAAVTLDTLVTVGSWNISGVQSYTFGGNALSFSNLITDSSTVNQMLGVQVSGAGGITLSGGSGTMILGNGTNSDTYSGATNIGAGTTLQANGTGAFSSSSAVTDNGTLDLNGASQTIGVLTGSGTVTSSVAGAVTLQTSGSGGSFTGNIQNGSGTVGLSLTGGTLTLSGNNTYSGPTTISSGATLTAGSATAFSASSAYTVSGTLDLAGNNNSILSLAGTSTGIVTDSGAAATLSIAGTIGTIFSGAISGANTSLAQTNNGGTLTLTGTNTYGGTTTIASEATLALSGTGSIANSSLVTNNGGTFNIANATAAVSVVSVADNGGNSLFALGGNTLILTNPSSPNISGNLTGTSAAVFQISAGRVNFGATTTGFAGTFNILSGATLALGSGGTAPNFGTNANIVDSGTITTAASSATVGIPISGTGVVTVTGGSTLIYSAANSYSGTTTIAPTGSLRISTGGTLGTGPVTDAGTLRFQGTANLTVTNAIAGGALIQQTGTGTTILTGNNSSYTGTFSITAGTLQFGNGGATGSLGAAAYSSTITNSGNLQFNLSSNVTVSGNITGGTLTQAGTGTITLTATENGSFNTVINSGGTVQLGSGSITGQLGSSGTVTDNGTLVFSSTGGNYSLGNIISGTGTVTQAGTNTVTFIGADTYSGATTINTGGILALSGSGSIANSAVADSGTLNISGVTVTGSIGSLSGSGIVTGGSKTLSLNAGTGTWTGSINTTGGVFVGGSVIETFNSAQTYTGGTTIFSGATLLFGANGSVLGNVTDNGLFGFNQSGTVIVTAATLANISGTGGLVQAGSGTLIVDTAVALTGTSSVTNGILEIGDINTPGASLAGGVNVGSGGTLEGHGTITGTITVASGGTLRPGGTIGTLSVTGPGA